MKEKPTLCMVQTEAVDHRATGLQMRQLRKGYGASLRAVAEGMGCSTAFLSDLELGKRNWTETRIANFVDACKPSRRKAK
jgi:predicted transcriptional regulator